MFPWAGAETAPPRAHIVWGYATGLYIPTDNIDTKTCYAAGALDGSNNLHTGGALVYLPFTTKGGNPTIGQTVWMAAGRDDNTIETPAQADLNRGWATATIPDTSIPDKLTGFPYGVQQVVVAGVCVDGEDTPGSGYFLVRLAATPFAPIPDVTPSDLSMTFAGATCYGGSYNAGPYFETDGTPLQMQLLDGESFVFTFTVDNVRSTDLVPGHYAGFASYDASFHGWEFAGTTVGVNGFLSNATHNISSANIAILNNPGINKIAVTNVGGKLRWTQNGFPTVGSGSIDTNAVSSADINGLAGAKFRIYWSIGAFCSMVKLSRSMTDTELVARSTPTPLSFTNNPWAPDPDLIVDLTCQWYLDLTSYAGGAINSIGGPAGTGFAWTKVGSPVSFKSWTINWHRSPKDLLMWAPGAAYDQFHHVAVPEMATFRGTCPNMEDFANIALELSIEDLDNSDESGFGIFANGDQVISLISPDVFAGAREQFARNVAYPFQTDWWERIATNGGPFTFDFLQADMLWRQGSFASGAKISAIGIPSTVTLEAQTTTRLLIPFMDGTVFGGHSSFLNIPLPNVPCASSSGGVLPYMRNDYPGKIIGVTNAVGCMYLATQWGGDGTIIPWARWLYSQRTTGSPATHEYLIATGYDDWVYGANLYNQPRDTSIAQWAALVDELHALDPTARIMIAPPPQQNLYAQVDIFGATLQSYVDAIKGLITGRPWLTLLDLTVPNAVAYKGLVHPGAGTCVSLADVLLCAANVKAAVGY